MIKKKGVKLKKGKALRFASALFPKVYKSGYCNTWLYNRIHYKMLNILKKKNEKLYNELYREAVKFMNKELE